MFRRTAGVLVVLSVVVVGCGSSGSDGAAAPSGLDVEQLDGEVRELLAMPQDQQLALIAALDTEVERELYVMSGLEAELGGSAATDEAFAVAGQGILDPILAMQATPPEVGSFGALRRAPRVDDPNLGEALFGGLIMTGLGVMSAVSASNDGSTGTRTYPEPNGQPVDPSKTMTLTISSPSPDKVGFDQQSEFTSNGVTTKLTTTVDDLVVCPDVNGQFTGSITIDMSATASAGATGQKGTIEVQLGGQVDDDAEISGLDFEIRTQYAKFADSRGAFIDSTVSVGTGVGSKEATGSYNRAGGAATAAFAQEATTLGVFIGVAIGTSVADQAKAAWQSGRCVTLEPTTEPAKRDHLELLQTVSISAAPRSKIDGGPVGGNVTAVLTGASDVQPGSTPVPADATFTYTAPGEKDSDGGVALEARSKRGIAKATLSFSTSGPQRYSASGGGGGLVITGTVDDITQPFTLQGTFPGGSAELTYVPIDENGGSESIAASGSGATAVGSGTYTISGDEGGPLTLTSQSSACVDVSGKCNENTEVIALTPID